MADMPRDGGSSGPGDAFGTDGHPSVETISAYTEDLLHPEAAAQVRDHLSDCEPCAGTRDALQEIRSLLGRAPTPRLPSEVAGRIDAALAAESLLAAELPGLAPEELDAAPEFAALLEETSAGADSAAVARLVAAEQQRGAAEAELPVDPAWSAALLSAAGVRTTASPADADEQEPPPTDRPERRGPARGQAGSPVAPATPEGTTTSARGTASSTAGSPGGAPRPSGGPAASRRGPGRRSLRVRAGRLLLGAAALATAAVVSLVVVNGEHQGGSSAGGSATSATAHGGTVFTASAFPTQVRRLVSGSARPSNGTLKPKLVPGGQGEAGPAAIASVPSCVLSATGRHQAPLTVSPGSYRGHPVYAVVYGSAGASGDGLDAYLVDAQCSGVLLHQVVPRS